MNDNSNLFDASNPPELDVDLTAAQNAENARQQQ